MKTTNTKTHWCDATCANCGHKCGRFESQGQGGEVIFNDFRITVDVPVESLIIRESGVPREGAEITRHHKMTRYVSVRNFVFIIDPYFL